MAIGESAHVADPKLVLVNVLASSCEDIDCSIVNGTICMTFDETSASSLFVLLSGCSSLARLPDGRYSQAPHARIT